MHTQKGRPSRIKGWVMPLVGFLVAQLYFIACDRFSWNPNREINPGTIMGRILNSKLFTEWFTPYNLPINNVITAFLIVTLLLPALIGAIKSIFFRK
ncbi:YfzA family protein [Paenibacillus sp. MER 180]|uniref:YfzA family protein n=1 Tax=Paenibacillus sp. MER 180 TaxID=2939570 RepID=UPI00203DB3FD|nr:YfzA family protein [Paenibacillus sp. MER 180]MCM3293420.1 YfzA family protein [Paenibacillus sp. MER 180]